jgi:hypothetical protein
MCGRIELSSSRFGEDEAEALVGESLLCFVDC